MPKKTNKQKIGVVILTYNAANFIETCIRSVIKNYGNNFEIIIVDNCSSDNTIEKIKSAFSGLKIIKTQKNLGYAGGNNIGIKYFVNKKVDYILLLNPDTLVDRKLIQELEKIMLLDKNIGTVGPIITYMESPQKIWFAGGYFNRTFCYTRHHHMNKSIYSEQITSGPVDFITGACILIRTDMLKKTGLLPEQYFLYFEDAFFCQNVIRMGYQNYLLAKPLVKHIVSASTGEAGKNTLSPVKAYYYGRNPLLYINEQTKGVQKIMNYIGQLAVRFPYYLLQMAKENNTQSIKAYIKGMYHGLRKDRKLN